MVNALLSVFCHSDSSTKTVPLLFNQLKKNHTDIGVRENIVDHLITEDVLTLDDTDIIDSSMA